MSKDGGPAFPSGSMSVGNGDSVPYSAGMSLRDYFAAHALAGILAESAHPQSIGSHDREQEIAAGAYRLADAMLKEREKNDDR